MANDKKIETLKQEIEEVKTGIADPAIAAEDLAILQSTLTGMEKKLAKLEAKQAEQAAKPAKEKPIKEKVKIGGKDLDELSVEEVLAAYNKRREQAKQYGNKFKSQSIISKIASEASVITQTAINAIPASEIKDNPEKAAKAAVKIGEVMEVALAKIREILKPFVENADMKLSEAAKKDLESFEKLASEIKDKYGK